MTTKAGLNPTDRAREATTRCVLTDADSAPLAVKTVLALHTTRGRSGEPDVAIDLRDRRSLSAARLYPSRQRDLARCPE